MPWEANATVTKTWQLSQLVATYTKKGGSWLVVSKGASENCGTMEPGFLFWMPMDLIAGSG